MGTGTSRASLGWLVLESIYAHTWAPVVQCAAQESISYCQKSPVCFYTDKKKNGRH